MVAYSNFLYYYILYYVSLYDIEIPYKHEGLESFNAHLM